MSPSCGVGGADEARGESVGKPMNPRAVKTPKRAPSLDRASGGLLSPEIPSGPGQIQPRTVWAEPGGRSIGWAGEFGASHDSHALPSKTGWGVSDGGHCGLSGGGQAGKGTGCQGREPNPYEKEAGSLIGVQFEDVRSGSLTTWGGTSPVRLNDLRGSSIGVVNERALPLADCG